MRLETFRGMDNNRYLWQLCKFKCWIGLNVQKKWYLGISVFQTLVLKMSPYPKLFHTEVFVLMENICIVFFIHLCTSRLLSMFALLHFLKKICSANLLYNLCVITLALFESCELFIACIHMYSIVLHVRTSLDITREVIIMKNF